MRGGVCLVPGQSCARSRGALHPSHPSRASWPRCALPHIDRIGPVRLAGSIAPIRNITDIRTDVGSSDVANAPCVVVSRVWGSVGISLLCAWCVVATWLPIKCADDHISGLERGLRACDVNRVGASEFLYRHGATESLQADLRRRRGDGKNALIYVHCHAVQQHELLVGGERLLRQNVRLCALEGAAVARKLNW